MLLINVLLECSPKLRGVAWILLSLLTSFSISLFLFLPEIPSKNITFERGLNIVFSKEVHVQFYKAWLLTCWPFYSCTLTQDKYPLPIFCLLFSTSLGWGLPPTHTFHFLCQSFIVFSTILADDPSYFLFLKNSRSATDSFDKRHLQPFRQSFLLVACSVSWRSLIGCASTDNGVIIFHCENMPALVIFKKDCCCMKRKIHTILLLHFGLKENAHLFV